MRARVADGVELDVVTQGDGTSGAVAFLLVHGLASNARMWDGVASDLARFGYASAAVDLRGHGRSDKPDDGYDLVTTSDDLVAVLDHLHWDRAVAVGQSWGGNVVVELARRRPDRLRGIAGIDGGTIELADRFGSWEECGPALAPPRLEGTPSDDIERSIRATRPGWPETGIRGLLANFEIRADGTVAPWLTRDRHLAVLRGLWEHRPSTAFATLRVPVLLVGADDGGPGLARKRAEIDRAVASIPEVRSVWLAGDHDLHAQFPVEVAALLHACCQEGFFR